MVRRKSGLFMMDCIMGEFIMAAICSGFCMSCSIPGGMGGIPFAPAPIAPIMFANGFAALLLLLLEGGGMKFPGAGVAFALTFVACPVLPVAGRWTFPLLLTK